MNLREEIERMRSQNPIDDAEYYSLSLFSSDGEKLEYSCFSSWDSFSDKKPKREIRSACKVNPKQMAKLYSDIDEPSLMVNNELDRKIFVIFGGHAIIEGGIAEKYFGRFLEPRETAQSLDPKYHTGGYRNLDILVPQKLKKAPYPKLRIKVLKRDNYKCRICGRSPDNYSDIELHVHHIRPYSDLGLTEKENLITLCHTCHKGLDPHFEWDLFPLIEQNGILPKSFFEKDHTKEYRQRLKNYQILIRKKLKKK